MNQKVEKHLESKAKLTATKFCDVLNRKLIDLAD